MQNILRSAKLHADTSTYVDRGTVQSLVKNADDPAIMGTVDNKKQINIRFSYSLPLCMFGLYLEK